MSTGGEGGAASPGQTMYGSSHSDAETYATCSGVAAPMLRKKCGVYDDDDVDASAVGWKYDTRSSRTMFGLTMPASNLRGGGRTTIGSDVRWRWVGLGWAPRVAT